MWGGDVRLPRDYFVVLKNNQLGFIDLVYLSLQYGDLNSWTLHRDTSPRLFKNLFWDSFAKCSGIFLPQLPDLWVYNHISKCFWDLSCTFWYVIGVKCFVVSHSFALCFIEHTYCCSLYCPSQNKISLGTWYLCLCPTSSWFPRFFQSKFKCFFFFFLILGKGLQRFMVSLLDWTHSDLPVYSLSKLGLQACHHLQSQLCLSAPGKEASKADQTSDPCAYLQTV